MKRILKALLSFLLAITAFSLVACDESPLSEVEKAIEKTENLDSYQALIEAKVAVSWLGGSAEVPMTVEVKAEGIQGENPRIYAKKDLEIPGANVTSEIYVQGGFAYVIRGDKTSKVNLNNLKNGLSYDYSEFIDEVMAKLPETLYQEAEIKEESGAKILTVSIPDSVFDELFSEIALTMGEMAMQSKLDQIASSNANVKIEVKDGYVGTYEIGYKMTVSVGALSAEANAEIKVSFENPGEKVTVTMPEGYESFTPIN